MAGDWIKMVHGLENDPAVIILSERLNLDPDAVLGKLYRLWSWADRQTEDGNAPGVTLSWLERYIGVAGFAEVLSRAGWLTITPEGISIPNFDRHNGKSAKRRALTTERVKRSRNAASVTEALPEKRREESIPKPKARRDLTVLPDAFEPTPAHVALATELGVDLADQLAKFRDHAHANARRQADWSASFANWLRHAPQFDHAPRQPTATAAGRTMHSIREAFEK